MKKFLFNIFTKRVEIKISNIPDEDRLRYVTQLFYKELVKQGKYEFDGTCASITIYEHKDCISVDNNDYEEVLRINKED